MSRTYRRRGERHDYDWVLRDSRWINGVLTPFRIDPRSREGRRAIARFHSDAYWTLRSTAPRWYRRFRLSCLPLLGAFVVATTACLGRAC